MCNPSCRAATITFAASAYDSDDYHFHFPRVPSPAPTMHDGRSAEWSISLFRTNSSPAPMPRHAAGLAQPRAHAAHARRPMQLRDRLEDCHKRDCMRPSSRCFPFADLRATIGHSFSPTYCSSIAHHAKPSFSQPVWLASRSRKRDVCPSQSPRPPWSPYSSWPCCR